MAARVSLAPRAMAPLCVGWCHLHVHPPYVSPHGYAVICGTDSPRQRRQLLNSDSREYIPTADSPFYCFPTPPFRLSFHLCFRVVPKGLYRCVCVFVPCGILRGPRVLRSGLVSEALRVVLRGFVVLPLFAQGQHYAVYLFFTTGGGGSVSLITLTRHVQFRQGDS